MNHATLLALNPRLVHCGISGYGNEGPMKQGKGYDAVLQAFSGMLSITGERGGPPVRSPYSPIDQTTGMHALVGIMAALFERSRTGRGGRIEASLFDTAVAFLGYIVQGYWEDGREPEKPGSSHDSLWPYEVFDARDKPFLLGVANDSLWRSFCAVAGVPALATDPRFVTNALRVQHRNETVAAVAALLKTRDRDEWIAGLSSAGIPCAPVHTLKEMLGHPHTAASKLVQRYDHRRMAQRTRWPNRSSSMATAAPSAVRHLCTGTIRAKCCSRRDIRRRKSMPSSRGRSLSKQRRSK